MGKEVKYIRVSTTEQNVSRQGESDYIDRCSGSIPLSEREAGSRLLKDIDSGKVSTIRVHSIDRLGRNTIDILSTIRDLTDKGINVISEKEGLQTLINGKENPTSKLILGVLATLSEFERSLILERQREGIREAKKRGVYLSNGGARRKPDTVEKFLSKDVNKAVLRRLKRGDSLNDARNTSSGMVSKPTVIKIKKAAIELGLL